MIRLLTICAALCLGAGAAQAQQGPGNGRFFKVVDASGDGMIQKPELESAVRRRFARQDTNGDGVVAWSEVLGGVTAFFAVADSNRDGSLSRAELLARASEARALMGQP